MRSLSLELLEQRCLLAVAVPDVYLVPVDGLLHLGAEQGVLSNETDVIATDVAELVQSSANGRVSILPASSTPVSVEMWYRHKPSNVGVPTCHGSGPAPWAMVMGTASIPAGAK